MGVVYRATQLDLGRPVAIKVIAADRARDPGLRTRFSLEARLAAAIDHPNLVPVHAAGEEDGRLYLVMRYVAGTDLHRALKRDGLPRPGPGGEGRLPGRRRAGRRARRRARAPRRQARQRPALRRARVPRRLRAEPPAGGRRADHRERRLDRHRRLHVARAPARGGVRRALGRLRARLRAVRGADRRAAVPPRHRPADDERAPAPAAAAPRPSARRCPPSSTT